MAFFSQCWSLNFPISYLIKSVSKTILFCCWEVLVVFYPLMVCVTVMCCNDGLNSTMPWVGCLLTRFRAFYLICRFSQILFKIYVTYSLNFRLSGSIDSFGKQPTQLNSSLRHLIGTHVGNLAKNTSVYYFVLWM